MGGGRELSPVLLVGAGTGEATCGILYLASYLRRGGIEAFVRLYDGDETDAEVVASFERLVARVRPRLVGISLKWFHHVDRALLIARTLRKIDPGIRIVVGGNSASYWWRELHAFDFIDHVVLGDGEVPLLAICQGEPSPPNCVTRSPSGTSRRLPLSYIQGATNTEDIYYSHFNELFLSQLDRNSFSGWVAPGKGCGENCLYCGGARGNQKAAFGRAKPFLRSEQSVRRDHQEIAPQTWQMRYDFAGSTAEFLGSTWAGVDLSKHCCTYFLWGVPRLELVAELARTFKRVYMVIDIGCFSEQQRLEQMGKGLLKPCAKDRELLDVIDACHRHPNLDMEISGIGGLPFTSKAALAEELRLVERVISLDCVVGYQRLEAQPGALVTEHPARFDMVTEAKTFTEFLDYFEQREPGDVSVPMIRFRDAELEAAVQRNSDQVDALAWKHRDTRRSVAVNGRTRLLNTSPSTQRFTLGDWLGHHRAPAKVAQEPVTVLRSVDGITLTCAPTVSPRKFSDPTLVQGQDGAILLAALAAFEQPATVSSAVTQLGTKARLDPHSAREVIDHLVDGRFLQPA
ncbi:cobalamin B12-binding domain-containing protein [Myxococcus sp. CA051A]|uniref:Cobalamin-binding protein n=1 Tax=Myxococcus llanfairpwllgwyngyllgogerychwyrndrobwllllantysiliogogogochensis TaxID=2590453 RepID=A0A540WY14_9BACT|nr:MULTISPECIES: cobalamin-dependent protein [Myxococcus]NTX01857.1 cobalamin B12-binding domain-containing protein [Myxococcus sp. CA040A]NTX62762.1 cobalamin B12-binding domain-containing protein [Myxococcus sp. CA051A]TQF13324.1 cobalamin-binding protein [Myxococcus llanfairpwllgwyngyllgogerychwyrndrobwllllantysiliogogogochensis]